MANVFGEVTHNLSQVVEEVQKARVDLEQSEKRAAESQKIYAAAVQKAKELKAQLDIALTEHLG